MKKEENKIGYIPIQHWRTTIKTKVCETPKHFGQNIQAFAVMALHAPEIYPNGVVQMVCKECWQHFDDELGNINWNLLEL